jgi:hypothetical protein
MAKNPKAARDNPILSRAKDHFEGLSREVIEVPEWGVEGEPLRIYYRPFTIRDNQQIYGRHRNDPNNPETLISVIIQKSETEEGDKMFSLDDKLALRDSVDGEIIARIANDIMGAAGVEEAEKN